MVAPAAKAPRLTSLSVLLPLKVSAPCNKMACDVPALAEHAPPYVHVDVELRPLARRGPDADRVLARCSCALVLPVIQSACCVRA